MTKINTKARVIAFYLPQFHTIPENDKWWGKGFTEWTNVRKAKPLFKNHLQPRVPADLGYYNILIPEIREAQANLARDAGIEGFCYWHYWFGNGKQLLERPFNEVLETGKPDFPFCLGWANHTWSNKTWNLNHNKEKILIEQLYPGKDDYEMHFNYVLKAFKDKRYITVEEKPLFLVYDPLDIPDTKIFISLWQDLAKKNGLKGIHFVGVVNNLTNSYLGDKKVKKMYIPSTNEKSIYRYNKIINHGFDALNSRGFLRAQLKSKGLIFKGIQTILKKYTNIYLLDKYNYQDIINNFYVEEDKLEYVYPTIFPNWDRSPRGGKNATIFINSTPELFKKNIRKALSLIEHRSYEKKILFLMSWNEWAEGNYMEPDNIFGKGYIDALREVLSTSQE